MSTQRINTGNATYQTRWPLQMFDTWHNVKLGSRNQSIANPDVVCPHCRNTGIVVLDHAPIDGAACPMCVIGRMQNKSWRARPRYDADGKTPIVDSAPPAEWCWKPQDDPAQYSWNHGMSVDHTTVCGRCRVLPALPGRVCSSCQVGAVEPVGLPRGVPRSAGELARGLLGGRTLEHVETENYDAADAPDWMEAS